MAAESDEQRASNAANFETIERIMKPFDLSIDEYTEVKNTLWREINKGLCKYTNSKATVKCLQTHIQAVPNGCETGKFLALDLGGTNFRVMYIDISDARVHEAFQFYALQPELLLGPGRDLFDFVAECLSNFIYSHQLENEMLPLGFTFSFPLRQVSIDKGILVKWAKGFNCPGVVGRDVVALLNEAIERRGDIMVKVVAILNDTTGTLITTAWKYRSAKIGLIVGTGSNACYMEKTKNITMYEGDLMQPSVMIINTEWGAMGDDGALSFVITKHDRTINNKSLNPKSQTFEKMISGMYLGELTRLCIMECIESGALLDGVITEKIKTEKSFITKFLSDIELDEDEEEYPGTRAILKDFGYNNPTNEDCKNLKYICMILASRSANLVGAAVACLVDRIGDPYITIGADGSLYLLNKYYHRRVVAMIKKLAHPEYKFDLIPSEDGSGRGAALAAAIVHRTRRRSSLNPTPQ